MGVTKEEVESAIFDEISNLARIALSYSEPFFDKEAHFLTRNAPTNAYQQLLAKRSGVEERFCRNQSKNQIGKSQPRIGPNFIVFGKLIVVSANLRISPLAISFFSCPVAKNTEQLASVYAPLLIPGLDTFREKIRHLSPSIIVGKLLCPDGLNWLTHALSVLLQRDDGVQGKLKRSWLFSENDQGQVCSSVSERSWLWLSRIISSVVVLGSPKCTCLCSNAPKP